MKDVLRSAAMAFLMFSVIPMPRVEWKKENMRYMLCCLPLVGAVIAGALYVWMLLSRELGFGRVLYAAGLTLLPVLLSGGIHLDGFCDTADRRVCDPVCGGMVHGVFRALHGDRAMRPCGAVPRRFAGVFPRTRRACIRRPARLRTDGAAGGVPGCGGEKGRVASRHMAGGLHGGTVRAVAAGRHCGGADRGGLLLRPAADGSAGVRRHVG